MKTKFLSFIIFFLIANQIFSQISGKILQKKNKKPVAFATVLLEGTKKYTTTDPKGFFKISTKKTKGTLKIIAMGFQKQVYKIKNANTNILIELIEDTENLKSVMVHGKSDAQKKREEPIKVAVLDLAKIQAQPTPLSQLINQESGVKVRQASGVGSPVSVNINGLQGRAIRYFKDGIPMEYLGKAFDLSSVPTDQLAALEIYKGMLPAALGTDALGGAINFKTKIPYKNNLQLSYMIGAFQTHQINGNAFLKIGKYFFINPTAYYVNAKNDYEITAPVMNEITRNQVDKKVKRFHDGIKSYYVSSKMGILNHMWADEFSLEA